MTQEVSSLRRVISTSPKIRNWSISVAIIVVLWLLCCALAGRFSWQLLFLNVSLAMFLGIAGAAQMTVVVAGRGAFDLSLPYVITGAAFVSGSVTAGQDSRLWLGLVAGLVVGVVAGAVTAAIVVFLDTPTIVATLATGYAVYSLALILQRGGSVQVSPTLAEIFHLQWNGINPIFLVGIVVLGILTFFLSRSTGGIRLHAVGQNARAARFANVRVNIVVAGSLVVSALLAALAGVLLAAYQGGALITMGDQYLLGSLAAIVIGGTPVTGGVSSIVSTVLGAITLTLLVTFLQLSGLGSGPQDIVEGAVVVMVVTLLTLRQRRRRR